MSKLDPRELRPGSYVLHKGEIRQLKSVGRISHYLRRDVDENVMVYVNAEELEPIEIEGEFLTGRMGFIKFNPLPSSSRFEKYTSYCIYDDKDNGFEVRDIESSYGDIIEKEWICISNDEFLYTAKELKFIHQIQDLCLIFMGKHLEIKL